MSFTKRTVLKSLLEYFGRGAAPVDGIYWVANEVPASAGPGAVQAASRTAARVVRINDAATSGRRLPGRSAPAARGM